MKQMLISYDGAVRYLHFNRTDRYYPIRIAELQRLNFEEDEDASVPKYARTPIFVYKTTIHGWDIFEEA